MKILFIDDNAFGLQNYVDALKAAGIEIDVRSRSDLALEALRNDGPYDAMVLDIMLPNRSMPEEEVADQDPQGLRTGYYFLLEARKLQAGLPAICFTNSRDRNLLEEIAEISGTKVVKKLEKLPYEFAKVVQEFVAGLEHS